MRRNMIINALAMLALVAICVVATGDTASADWLRPDYIDKTGETSIASSESPSDENENAIQAKETVTNGFRPEVDGFSFSNYGGEYGDGLRSAEMARMFGERVCARKTGDECILTPPANRWMHEINDDMKGGHCEGMAVLSTLMYYGKISPLVFGAERTHDLSIENESLQHEIAYWFATQFASPISGEKLVKESPSAVLDTLLKSLKEGKSASEMWVVGIYQPDGKGGHANTPFGVEDIGNDKYQILVYENQEPNTTEEIKVDKKANTWSYGEDYAGDANTQNLEVVAISPRMDLQQCDFCDEDKNISSHDAKEAIKFGLRSEDQGKLNLTEENALAPALRYLQIWLDGNASLLITDELGRRTGRVEINKTVNEIPGAQIKYFKFGELKLPERRVNPVYKIPAGLNFSIKVDGTWLSGPGQDEEYVTMIGPGYDLAVEGLLLDQGEQDYIDVATVGREHYRLTYRTNYTDSPYLIIGRDTDLASYEFMARGEKIGPEGEFRVELDMKRGVFVLNPVGNQESDQFELLMHRIDDYGEQFFGAKNILLKSNDTAYLSFLDWREGQKLYLNIDRGRTGMVGETVEMKNNTEFRKYWA